MNRLGLFLVLSLTACSEAAYQFMSLGDWGGAAISQQDKQNVYDVAEQMDKTAAEYPPAFILSLGDLFYWCGIQNTSDPQIAIDFEEPYSTANLKDLDWYNVLGNHEYGYNSQAVLDYANNNSHWIIPERYYTKRLEIDQDSNQYMTMIFLDTSPCVAGYRSSDPAHWDPCSNDFPTCSPGASDDDFEGPCEFNKNILEQNCTAQYQWLQKTLENVDENDWLVMVGHHPLDEVNVHDFTKLVQDHGFSIYLNGHAHTLTFYQLDGKGAYVTSGAGSLVDTPDQAQGITAKKVRGDPTVTGVFDDLDVDGADGGEMQATKRQLQAGKKRHDYTTVWNEKIAGFTTHEFSTDFTSMVTRFIAYNGEELYKFTSYKDGTVEGL